MIEKIGKVTYLVTCDKCDYERDFEDIESFSELIEQMKQKEWENKKVNVFGQEEYKHYCSNCRINKSI